MIEFFHGYTYSGNPVAAAAGLGTLETYKDEGLLTRGAALAKYWEDALHSLKGLPHVIDIRNLGLDRRGRTRADRRSADQAGLLGLRQGVRGGHPDPHHRRHHRLSPPLIIEKAQIDTLIGKLGEILKGLE